MPIAQPNDETASALVPDPTIPGRASHHYLELDGLRGIAIILVLLFHAFLELKWDSPAISAVAKVPTAGWVGVDVFFVLSGFLITGILLDTKSNFAYFRNFYARRALRIFPVYYLDGDRFSGASSVWPLYDRRSPIDSVEAAVALEPPHKPGLRLPP